MFECLAMTPIALYFVAFSDGSAATDDIQPTLHGSTPWHALTTSCPVHSPRVVHGSKTEPASPGTCGCSFAWLGPSGVSAFTTLIPALIACCTAGTRPTLSSGSTMKPSNFFC